MVASILHLSVPPTCRIFLLALMNILIWISWNYTNGFLVWFIVFSSLILLSRSQVKKKLQTACWYIKPKICSGCWLKKITNCILLCKAWRTAYLLFSASLPRHIISLLSHNRRAGHQQSPPYASFLDHHLRIFASSGFCSDEQPLADRACEIACCWWCRY